MIYQNKRFTAHTLVKMLQTLWMGEGKIPFYTYSDGRFL